MAVVAMFFEDGALRMPSTIIYTVPLYRTVPLPDLPVSHCAHDDDVVGHIVTTNLGIAKHVEAIPDIPEAIHGHPWPPDPIEWCRTSPATARPQVISGDLRSGHTVGHTAVTPCQLRFAVLPRPSPSHISARQGTAPSTSLEQIGGTGLCPKQWEEVFCILHHCALNHTQTYPNIGASWCFSYDIESLYRMFRNRSHLNSTSISFYQCSPSWTCDSISNSAAESPSRKRRSTNRSCAFQSTAQRLQIRTAPQPHGQRPSEGKSTFKHRDHVQKVPIFESDTVWHPTKPMSS